MNPLKSWKDHDKKVLTEFSEQLRDCKSAQGVLDCLGLIRWDYLNPDIYGFLIRTFSLHCLKEQLASYRNDLDRFMEETPVKVFSDVVREESEEKKEVPKGLKPLVTRHKWKSPVYLKDVELFRRKVAQRYQLQDYAVFLVECGIKSLIITLLVPSEIEDQLYSSTKPDFFEEHRIIAMEFCGISLEVYINYIQV